MGVRKRWGRSSSSGASRILSPSYHRLPASFFSLNLYHSAYRAGIRPRSIAEWEADRGVRENDSPFLSEASQSFLSAGQSAQILGTVSLSEEEQIGPCVL